MSSLDGLSSSEGAVQWFCSSILHSSLSLHRLTDKKEALHHPLIMSCLLNLISATTKHLPVPQHHPSHPHAPQRQTSHRIQVKTLLLSFANQDRLVVYLITASYSVVYSADYRMKYSYPLKTCHLVTSPCKINV